LSPRKTLLKNIAEIILLKDLDHPTRVAIDGINLAGKKTFADELTPIIEGRGRKVIRSSIDGFQNPKNTRYARGRYSPEGYYLDNFNYSYLLDELLLPLGPNGNLIYKTKIFDHQINKKVNFNLKKASKDSILLFDGIFLLRPELLNQWDLKIYLDIEYEESKKRGLKIGKDNLNEINFLFEKRYIPGQKLYHIHADPKRYSDIIIDNNLLSNPQITY
jgi:uridine kinase